MEADDDLEPIALAHIEDGEVVGISRDGGDSWTTQSISSLSCDPEPLVQLSRVRDRLKAVVESAHKAPVDDVGQEIVEEVYELIDELEDFTQKGESSE